MATTVEIRKWADKQLLGKDGADLHDDVLRDSYAWAQAHPNAGFGEIEHYAINLEGQRHTSDYSIADRVQQSLSPPGHFGKSSVAADPTGASGASGPSGAAPPAVPGTPAADVQSQLNAVAARDPGFAAFRALHPEYGAQSQIGTINYWSASGVDPTAKVLGKPPLGREHPGTTGSNQSGYDRQRLYGIAPEQEPITQSADAWLKGLYQMAPTALAELQHRLWSQGWYAGTKITDPAMIRYGQPDAATLTAYVSVLSEAARYHYAGKRIGIDGVIDLGSPLKEQAKAQGAPFEKTNPANLSAALRTQAQQDLGRDATPAETAAFQQQYLSQEEAARRELISAGIANRTEGVTTAGDPSAAAQQFLDTHNLADRIAYGAATRQQMFYSLLKSPV